MRLATRGSPLALAQARSVGELLERSSPPVEVELVVVQTRGDREAEAPLGRLGGQGVFVKEVQAAVLEGRADIAVHSAKDLPSLTPDGLVIAAVPARGDPRDALVGARLDDLAAGATVATGSARRRAQLANLRPDLRFVEARGNMATRLARAGTAGVAAVVVAMAALERLGWTGQAREVLDPLAVLPQAGQGALALECRSGDSEVRALVAALDQPETHQALDAERAFLAALSGGCTLPVAAWARHLDGELVLDGLLASGDGRLVVRMRRRGGPPEVLGQTLARAVLGGFGEQDRPPAPPAPPAPAAPDVPDAPDGPAGSWPGR